MKSNYLDELLKQGGFDKKDNLLSGLTVQRLAKKVSQHQRTQQNHIRTDITQNIKCKK